MSLFWTSEFLIFIACLLFILESEFAEEGIDYEGFDINVEGNLVKDYKLTAKFAKKLSCVNATTYIFH